MNDSVPPEKFQKAVDDMFSSIKRNNDIVAGIRQKGMNLILNLQKQQQKKITELNESKKNEGLNYFNSLISMLNGIDVFSKKKDFIESEIESATNLRIEAKIRNDIFQVEVLDFRINEILLPQRELLGTYKIEEKEKKNGAPGKEKTILNSFLFKEDKRKDSNIPALMKSLIAGGFVSNNTTLVQIRKVLSNKTIDEPISWHGGSACLSYFIKALYKNVLVEGAEIKWQLTVMCFVDNFRHKYIADKLRKQNKPALKYVELLDNCVALLEQTKAKN